MAALIYYYYFSTQIDLPYSLSRITITTINNKINSLSLLIHTLNNTYAKIFIVSFSLSLSRSFSLNEFFYTLNYSSNLSFSLYEAYKGKKNNKL